jgi:hypothetical protein
MDLPATISAVGAALGVVKELKAIENQFDQALLKLKIAELTSALADAKLGLVDVSEQLHAKDEEIAELKRLVRYRADNLVDYNGYRYPSKDGKPDGIPYCPACEAKDRLFIRLVQDMAAPHHPFKCPHCKANYGRNGIFQRAEA